MADPVIEVKNVVKRAPGRNGVTPPVLDDLSFTVDRGEVFILLGPSGCGKSTTLRLLSSLDSPDAGAISVLGRDLATGDVKEHRRRLAIVFQLPIFLPGSVADNLCYGLLLRGMSRTHARQKALECLELAGLHGDMLDRVPATLSPGEQQRASIARALVGDPEIVLLDEPTSALDPTAGKHILDLVASLQERLGLTIVLVTHNLEQARHIGSRGLILHNGRAVESAAFPDLFDAPRTETTRLFLAGNLPGRSTTG